MKTEWKTSRVVIDLLVETFVEKNGSIQTKVINTAMGNVPHLGLGTLEQDGGFWFVTGIDGDGKRVHLTNGNPTKGEAIKAFELGVKLTAVQWAVR